MVGLKVWTDSKILWDRAEAARKAHNLEVEGSIPSPATNFMYWSNSSSHSLTYRMGSLCESGVRN